VGEFPLDDYEGGLPDEQNGTLRGKLKIVIDWGALDIDRAPQTISERNDADTILELLRALIDTFGKHMREQLTEIPIIRFPLSADPSTAFLNRAKNKPYSNTQVPGTDPALYFCPQSQQSEKLERLKALLSRLTLPDGSEFPADCITLSIEGGLEDPH
jgi:hypothetical protein